jgi:LPS-assembly protein
MPAFMLRSSPIWIALASFASIMPLARADDPPCPSQIAAGAREGLLPNTPGNSTPGNSAQVNSAATAQAASAGSHAPATGATNTGGATKELTQKLAAGGNVDITSDLATLGADGKITLSGNVHVHQGDRDIQAEQVQYDSNDRSLSSDSHIDYTDPLLHVAGAGGSYSETGGAEFHGAQFDLRQRAARGTAQEMSLTPEGTLKLKGVTFTTCPRLDKSWQIKANSIVLDTQEKLGTGRDAEIEFMGVPLMYLPWASFPLSSERKSGFLFPGIGNTSTNGLQLSVPYYWNIAPNFDVTFEPILYSKAGADLGGEMRFLTESQRGELEWNYLPDDRSFGSSRSRLLLTDVAELPDDWRLNLSAENVSDTSYFEDFSQGPEGASTPFLDRRATLTYRSEHWSIDGEAQQYQTIDYTLLQPDRPYAEVPRLAVDSDYTFGPGGLLHYGFASEVVNFEHSEAPSVVTTGWRADILPQVSLDMSGPGYFVRPAFAWRATQYELQTLGPDQLERSPSRTLPITSFDSGLVFERAVGSHDQRKLTLEPRILYVDVPYRNQDQLPVFDTAVPDLNPVELFRTNRYVGSDRVSDANQLSAGLTSRLLDGLDGRQFVSATIGQTFYFETPRVLLPGEVPVTGKRSDFVAQLALTAFQDFSAETDVQWDPENERSERTNVHLQYKPALNSVINFFYRYERFVTTIEPIPEIVNGAETLVPTPVQQGFDQFELSGAWPIRQNWSIFARDVYSLRDPGVAHATELERFAGFEYRACCWRIRLGARRYVNNHNGSQNTGIWLQLELAGLSGVGSASDAFLTDEIRGYMPPESTNIRAQGPLRSIY